MRRHAVILCMLALAAPADALAGDWQRLSGRQPVPAGARVHVAAVGAAAFTLDHAALRRRLGAARPVIRIPAPDGTLQRFRAVDSPVMAPALQRRHPNLRSFSATGVDDPTATARFDVGALGFHASVRSDRGSWYVDPRFVADRSQYLSYSRAELVDRHGDFVEHDVEELGRATAKGARAPGDPVVKRTYDLALANDPTYAAYFGSANVAAAKVALVNRVNQIYNDDLAIELVLVGGDTLNFDTADEYDDYYTAGLCTAARLSQNQAAIDQLIGDENYDVGHLLLGTNAGGAAQVGVIGVTGKARGCSGATNPTGDPFFVDYVAHELGHQFGARHTFNGTTDSCGTERNDPTAVEPGSGSSIMGYAGLCDEDDLQDNSDPYFSQQSIENIQNEVDDPGQGGTLVPTTTNNAPDGFTAPSAVTIPIRTPFRLEGLATDAPDRPLVYTWEQDDPGTGTALTDPTKPFGPLFRSVAPTPSGGLREFPDRAQIAADNTNAETGTCTNVDCFSEFLPESPRTLHFRLTARDRAPEGGGVSAADTAVSVAGTAPFAVTGPASSQLTGATTTEVTWDVAGTSVAPFNVTDVRISFSDDGGLTFPTVVAASTPNDGAETVPVPNVSTTTGRYMVEAIGNVFFDISDAVPNAAPTPSPSPSPEPTADYEIPTPTPTTTSAATATPTPTRIPGRGRLGPDLALVRRALTPDAAGRIKLSLRCRQLTPGTRPAVCTGKVRIVRRGRTIAAKRFSFGSTRVGLVTLRVDRRTRATLRRRSVKAKLVAKVGRRTARKAVNLRRIR